MKTVCATVIIAFLFGCKASEQDSSPIGSVETLDPAFRNIVDSDAAFEILGEGYEWSEGPVWIPAEQMLLFSDVPNNVVYKWTAAKGVEEYLKPSGFTGEASDSKESGSNGLALSPDGKLVLCQHGDRRVAYLAEEGGTRRFVTLSDNYNGKKLSSPNDVTFQKDGDMFFTDPPYGLPTQSDSDPLKEQPHNGVYKVVAGKTTLLVDSLTRPNGIEFLPGQRTLLVANSDPERVRWYAYELDERDSVVSGRIFYDATSNFKGGENGLPDGLAVDNAGNVFATGPGGVWVFNAGGKPLGRIRLQHAAANCELSEDQKALFITNDMYLVRVKLRK